MIDKIIIIETIHGYNPCFKRAHMIAGRRVPFAHDTATNEPHAGRFTDASKWLEEKGYWVRKYNNHWNKNTVRKEVHAFGGLDARGNFVICQHLPFDFSAWGCAGSYNYDPTAHIQIEICEDDKKHKNYYEMAMENVAAFFAWLIQQGICKCSASEIVDHRTAHKQGGANNHGDIWDWASKQGEDYSKYMDNFRARVQRYLDRGPVEVEWHYSTAGMPDCKQSTKYNAVARYLQTCLNRLGYKCDIDGLLWNETITQLQKFQRDWYLLNDGICGRETWAALEDAMNGKVPVVVVPPVINTYFGIVKTNKGNGISLWKNTTMINRACKVPENAKVEVTSSCIQGTLAPAKYSVYSGYVDTRYIVEVTSPIAPTTPTPSEPAVQHYIGIVKTKSSGCIGLYDTVGKDNRLLIIKDGEKVEVTNNCINKTTMAPAVVNNISGYVDTQYLVNHTDIK